MAFSNSGSIRFSAGLGLRAVALSGLAFAAIVLATRGLVASALVTCGLAVLTGLDLWRTVTRTDKMLAQVLDSLLAGETVWSSPKHSGFFRLKAALQSISDTIGAAQTEREKRIGYLQALLDTVGAALIVVRSDGAATLVNHAARRLAKGPIDRLEDIRWFDPQAVEMLRTLPPGARRIVPLTDGRQVFVSTTRLTVPGRTPERLMALQPIAGELDAVELRAWQDMVRVLSHEMMNSLTPISSLSQSLGGLIQDRLHEGERTADAMAAIEAINRRSIGLMDFVERYRKIAELPSPSMRSIRAADFVRGIDDLIAADLRASGILYESRVSPPALVFSGDSALLEQALINVLRNAMDAVKEAQAPAVSMVCSMEADSVVFEIADNGCGLPETNAGQIFVPFFTTKPNGSGIGLSLVRQIALAHGGRVEAARRQAAGAIFKISLPIENW